VLTTSGAITTGGVFVVFNGFTRSQGVGSSSPSSR
jgi:hypothetical protein